MYTRTKGKGVMLQGSATSTKGHQFEALKQLESASGWKLDTWKVGRIGKQKVDVIVVFRPQRLVVIGNL